MGKPKKSCGRRGDCCRRGRNAGFFLQLTKTVQGKNDKQICKQKIMNTLDPIDLVTNCSFERSKRACVRKLTN